MNLQCINGEYKFYVIIFCYVQCIIFEVVCLRWRLCYKYFDYVKSILTVLQVFWLCYKYFDYVTSILTMLQVFWLLRVFWLCYKYFDCYKYFHYVTSILTMLQVFWLVFPLNALECIIVKLVEGITEMFHQ